MTEDTDTCCMQRLILLFSHRPWIWLSLLLLASMLAATQIGELRVRVSANEMLVADDPQRAYYDQVKAAFGEEQLVLLVVEDTELLAPEKLEVLRGVVTGLEALPFVDRAESLFSVPHVRSVDGYLDKAPYLASLPETAAAGRELLAAATGNPLIRNVLVSQDGEAMAVAVILQETDGGVPADDHLVTGALEQAIQPLLQVYDRAYPIGFPQVRTEIARRIIAEQNALMPLAVAALLIQPPRGEEARHHYDRARELGHPGEGGVEKRLAELEKSSRTALTS